MHPGPNLAISGHFSPVLAGDASPCSLFALPGPTFLCIASGPSPAPTATRQDPLHVSVLQDWPSQDGWQGVCCAALFFFSLSIKSRSSILHENQMTSSPTSAHSDCAPDSLFAVRHITVLALAVMASNHLVLLASQPKGTGAKPTSRESVF
jgi:hypothetical protein